MRARCVLAAMLVFAPADPCVAEEHFEEGALTRTNWTIRDGLPSNVVRAVAQTGDGFLWIGTFGGLARFDGVRFVTFNLTNAPELGSPRIRVLLADRSGTLWIGTAGGVARYRAGRFEHVDIMHDIRAMAEGPEGIVWFGGSGLARWVGGAVEHLPKVREAINSIHVDAQGVLWAAGEEGVVRVDGESVTRMRVSDSFEHSFVLGATGGEVLVAGADGAALLPSGRIAIPAAGRRGQARLWNGVRDEADHYWLGTPEGLMRLPASALSTDGGGAEAAHCVCAASVTGGVNCLFLDRHEDLWMGAETTGLHRLRRRVATGIPLPGDRDRFLRSLAVERDGSLWVSCIGLPGIVRIQEGAIAESVPDGPAGAYDGAYLTPARSGGLWIAHRHGLTRFLDGSVRHLDVAAEPMPLLGGCFEARDGSVWWFGGDHQSRRVGTRETAYGQLLAEGRDGHLYFALPGRLLRLADGQPTMLTGRDGLPPGEIRALYEDAHGYMWIATYGGGLGCLRGNRITRCDHTHGLPDDSLGAILEDDRHRFWINSNRGIFTVHRSDLVRFVDGEAATVPCRLVTHVEGNGSWGARGEDGRLYFDTIEGPAVMDPDALAPLDGAPRAHVEGVEANGRWYERGAEVALPLGVRDVRIEFTAPCFNSAEGVQFRYRLRGYDPEWVDAGTRRQAYYTGLPPGSYRFEARAGNAEGGWSPASDALTLRIPPNFHERGWFRVGLALLGVAAVFLAYLARTAAMRRRNRALVTEIGRRSEAEAALRDMGRRLMSSKEEEAARIARELHDDFSQRLALLTIRIEMLGPLAPADILELVTLSKGLSSDLHRLSHSLHPAKLEQLGLVAALRSLAREVGAGGGLRVDFAGDEVPGRLADGLALALYRIAQEALRNAASHSGAAHASLTLAASETEILLEVADRGAGFDPGRSRGGLGLLSMAERARAIGGSLEVVSAPDRGTQVRARVPRPPAG